MTSAQADVALALDAIERWGLILLQDPTLQSLAALIAGEPVRGSWWGHPAGSRIFDAGGVLDDHPDIAAFKLIDGKVCFVHRRLWPALRAIGEAREPWQLAKLDRDAKVLLARIDAGDSVLASGNAAKTLETRLLAVGHQVHTESGAHKNALSSWKQFAKERALSAAESTPEQAKRAIERAIDEMGGRGRKLPWPRVSPSGS